VRRSRQSYGETEILKVDSTVFWVAGCPFDLGVFVSSASTVKEVVELLFVGVPEMAPVDLSSLRPRGSFPDPGTSLKLYGAHHPFTDKVAE
jgi:hypothetical protein